jgi:hypothetical protein
VPSGLPLVASGPPAATLKVVAGTEATKKVPLKLASASPLTVTFSPSAGSARPVVKVSPAGLRTRRSSRDRRRS